MIIKALTKTQSIYEIDKENCRVRRITGKEKPTDRQGKDGEWREYFSISNVKLGKSMMICWKVNEDGTYNCTTTSPIELFLEDN